MDPEKKASQIAHLLELNLLGEPTHPFPDEILLEIGLQEFMSPEFQLRQLPFPITMQKGEKVVKNSKESCVICCVMGEKALAANENNEALKAFTNALRLAPASSNMMAHCYYYRSLALRKLNAYSESLQDIDRALGLPITKEQRENLQKRKTFIQKLLLESNSQNLSYGENTEINGVSSALALVYTKRFRRHFVATRDIQVGDVLMIQKPYVTVISQKGDDSPEGKEWFCENCFKTTKAPIPCDNCAMVFYCSVGCQSEAYDKFHKIECKLANINAFLGPFSLLFLRTMLIVTKQGENLKEACNLLSDVRRRTDERTSGFKNGKLDGTNAEAILSLRHHMKKQNFPMITLNTIEIAEKLRNHTDFLEGSNQFRCPTELLQFLSHICIMDYHFLRRNNSKNITALSMFPVISLLNHSCACNTLSYNDKQGNTIVRACKEIKKGEQIFVSYLTFESIFLTAEERNRLLQEKKFFTCKCVACMREYTYKLELRGELKVPEELKYRLQNGGNDIEALWIILKLILKTFPLPCLEAKTLELALVDAYLGSDNESHYKKLDELNIF